MNSVSTCPELSQKILNRAVLNYEYPNKVFSMAIEPVYYFNFILNQQIQLQIASFFGRIG
ncbi:hypothetical protein CAL7102_06683 [Dulcicalothrix desertica PCC 7102]|nr:hypothetical protein CAL7102_06683 [Dulcicalothrix desertica PCC 7102]